MTPSDVHLDTGARALDSLPADEARRFDEHLSTCDHCAAEYAGFLETTALLGTAAAETAPEALERRLVRLIAVTAQLPPTLRHDDASPRRHRRPWAMVAAVAVTIAMVAAAVLAVRAAGSSSQVADAKACVQAAPDARTSAPSVGDGGEVTVADSCHVAIIQLPPLPDLPAANGYQLWVMAGSQARSQGMVQTQIANGPGTVVAPIRAGDTDVGITIEPAGGSPAPTSQPVWVVPVSR